MTKPSFEQLTAEHRRLTATMPRELRHLASGETYTVRGVARITPGGTWGYVYSADKAPLVLFVRPVDLFDGKFEVVS